MYMFLYFNVKAIFPAQIFLEWFALARAVSVTLIKQDQNKVRMWTI